MLNFAGKAPLVTTCTTDSHQLIATDLRSLIARIDISLRLIDAVMAEEDAGGHVSVVAGSNEIVVLDDVTPRYATASAALIACRTVLDHTLQQLSESGSPA
ncbi:hypothetical protein ACSHT2_21965 [Bradyrhizobium sp. PUT101]|uniref:hypothetical protein n=1 Tax=Bradyrhizobium sp. PUT101 TaxID=3447427 RepID=UPI003F83817F